MRRNGLWLLPVGLLGALVLGVWGVWTYRLAAANSGMSLALEAERQRNFNDMAHHVEQIQSLLGKGLVTGTTRQNMRYMSDVYNHAQAAVNSFTSLPLPAEISAGTGKFLQQTGDFAVSLLRNEAAGREMTSQQRAELARLRQESTSLSAQMQSIMAQYNQGGFRWNPPVRFSWAALTRGPATSVNKPAGTQSQAPENMVPGGWDQVGQSMQKLPVMVYDGPFSDHIGDRAPAAAGAPITRDEAARRISAYVPNPQAYTVAGVEDVNGNLPAFSFRLAPAGAAPGGATPAYTTFVDVARNGGHLLQLLNSRMVGKPAIDLPRAKSIGLEYLSRVGYQGMAPTYGEVADGTATIAYAYRENGVMIYPDQIKVKIALDTGEVLGVDARQYLMNHHPRKLGRTRISAAEAEEKLNPELNVQRTQLALVPNLAGTGEILTHEFLTNFGKETYLVYINAETGQEEQILQVIQSENGTFAL